MRTLVFVLLMSGLADAQALRPLHVSPAGGILDDRGVPVALRGVNNSESNSTDAEYAAQTQLLSTNVVRLIINPVSWNGNVQNYQSTIDGLIQRAKKYGNYVIAVCDAPDTDTAFTFWASFAKMYAADPAILYDTVEDTRGADANTWSNDQNQLIAAIRTYSPASVIFVEDTGTAFEQIVAGTLPDLAWSNLVWNFHLYAGPSGTCTTAASARYANWPKNIDPLVAYAERQGHGLAIAEWGGCNDSEPYHTNITSYAQAHEIALVYYDSTNLIAASGNTFQLTATGTKVAAAYKAIAAGGPTTVTSVSSTNGAATLAPEAIASAYGAGLATATQNAASVPLPLNLAGTSVIVTDVNGISRTAELFYVSSTQINYQVPPGIAVGKAAVTVMLDGDPAAFGTATIAAIAPGLYTVDGSGKGTAAGIVFTRHANGATNTADTTVPIDLGADSDQVTLELFGSGIRGHAAAVTCKIGTTAATVEYAGPQNSFVGLDQVNITLPKSLRGSGTQPLTLTVDGQTTGAVNVSFR